MNIEFDSSTVFAIQNYLLLGFGFCAVLSAGIIIQRGEVIVNGQFILASISLLAALASTFWAYDPFLVVQRLKFDAVLFLHFFLMINIIKNTKQAQHWIQLSFVGLAVTVLVLCYSLVVFGSIRHQISLISFHASIGLVTLPVSIHFIYYRTIIPARVALIATLLSLFVVFATSSRMAILAVLVFIIGLVIIDHGDLAGWAVTRLISSLLLFIGGSIGVIGLALQPELSTRIIDRTILEHQTFIQGLSEGKIDTTYPGRTITYLVMFDTLSNISNVLLGVGWNNFTVVVGEATGFRYSHPPHNMYLKHLLGTGILGSITFFVSTLYPFRYLISSTIHRSDRETISLIFATGWGLIMLVIFFQTHPLLNKIFFYLLCAVSYALYTTSES